MKIHHNYELIRDMGNNKYKVYKYGAVVVEDIEEKSQEIKQFFYMHPRQNGCRYILSHFIFDRFEWIRKLFGGPKMTIVHIDPSEIIWIDEPDEDLFEYA